MKSNKEDMSSNSNMSSSSNMSNNNSPPDSPHRNLHHRISRTPSPVKKSPDKKRGMAAAIQSLPLSSLAPLSSPLSPSSPSSPSSSSPSSYSSSPASPAAVPLLPVHSRRQCRRPLDLLAMFVLGALIGASSFLASNTLGDSSMTTDFMLRRQDQPPLHFPEHQYSLSFNENNLATADDVTDQLAYAAADSDTYRDTNSDAHHGGPKIAWLMSFPNSGTSYTLEMVATVTKHCTGTNYGQDNIRHREASIPIYDIITHNTPNHSKPQHNTHNNLLQQYSQYGLPIWDRTTPNATIPSHHILYPQTSYTKQSKDYYVLTKTHCAGYCLKCPPNNYITTPNMFLDGCRSGMVLNGTWIASNSISSSSTSNNSSSNNSSSDINGKYGTPVIIHKQYPATMVHRAIHLFRNPFDNIVSRFNYEHTKYTHEYITPSTSSSYSSSSSPSSSSSSFSLQYPKNKKGFRKFCQSMHETYWDMERKSPFLTNPMLHSIRSVPCYADFIRYVLWHNNAFVTAWDMGVPTLILHYENYTLNYNETLHSVLDFLNKRRDTQYNNNGGGGGDDNNNNKNNNNEEVNVNDNQFNPPPKFVTGKIYKDEYFTKEEVKIIQQLFMDLGSSKTWMHTKHYFDD